MDGPHEPTTRPGGTNTRLGRIVLAIVLSIFVGLPVLFLATCTYTSFSPHLRTDPLTRVLMDAPRHADVVLTPDYLQVGQSQEAVMARLEAAGYELFADYSTDIAPPDPHPTDAMPQAALDKMFAQAKAYHNALGITHIYHRGGRARPACGESLFIEIGFNEDGLTRASGYSRWTCL